MGCTPPEKRHQSIPAINAVPKKAPYLSPRQSQQSKSSTQTNENNVLQLPIPKLPSNESLKSQRKSPKQPLQLQKRNSAQGAQSFSYEHQDSPQKPIEKDVIRIVSPRDKPTSPKKLQKEDMFKQTSVHSLDIISRIKAPKDQEKKVLEAKKEGDRRSQAKSSKVEEVNITFNHNDFAVAQSKASPTFGRKRWREEALINELKTINNENFKRIPVNSRNYN